MLINFNNFALAQLDINVTKCSAIAETALQGAL